MRRGILTTPPRFHEMLDRTHIVVVTDIEDHASNYRRALGHAGFVVTLATSAESARAVLRERRPQCIVIDVRLPDVTGWELCRQTKADPNLRGVPIIVLAREVSAAQAENSARSGCNAWLARPLMAEDLVSAVQDVLAAEEPEPPSAADALLHSLPCPSCASADVRAVVRVSPAQYYKCTGCGFYWRVAHT